MMNLLVLPGLGTILVGRKIGLVQMLLALIGFISTMAWFVMFIRAWIDTQQFPDALDSSVWIAVGGVFLVAVAWIWALASSLSMIREARR